MLSGSQDELHRSVCKRLSSVSPTFTCNRPCLSENVWKSFICELSYLFEVRLSADTCLNIINELFRHGQYNLQVFLLPCCTGKHLIDSQTDFLRSCLMAEFRSLASHNGRTGFSQRTAAPDCFLWDTSFFFHSILTVCLCSLTLLFSLSIMFLLARGCEWDMFL